MCMTDYDKKKNRPILYTGENLESIPKGECLDGT